MDPCEEGKIASALARQAIKEDQNALKVIVADNGHLAGVVFTLLAKVHRIPKDRITQLGYTSSDQQNAQFLEQKKHFVIVPKDIINNRPCVFHLPDGTKHIDAIQYLDDEVFAMPITCESGEFQFKPGWFA